MNTNTTEADDFNYKLYNRKNGLLITQWNVDGLSDSIITAINHLIYTKNSNALILQELSINYQIINYLHNVPGYTPYAMNLNYGKAVTLIRNDTKHNNIPLESEYNDNIDKKIQELNIYNKDYELNKIDLLMQKIYMVQTELITKDDDQDILLLNGYRPQNGKNTGTKGCPIEEILLHIEKLKIMYPRHKFIHGMDLNGHNDLWMKKVIKNKNSKAAKTGTIYANWLYDNGWLILNNGDSTRIVITENKYEITTPDTTAVDSNFDTEDIYWWTENYGRLSDHSPIFILIDDEKDYKQLMDKAYTLRIGDERNWDELNKEIKIKTNNWMKEKGELLENILIQYKNLEENKIDEKGNYINELLNKNNIDMDFIHNSIKEYVYTVIARSSKEILGMKMKNNYIETPWITEELLQIKTDYDNYYKQFKTWSQRKKKKKKHELNAFKKEYEKEFEIGYTKWVNNTMKKGQGNHKTTYKQINEIINYGNKQSTIIPTLYNKQGDKLAENNKEIAELLLKHKLRFEKKKQIENEENENNKKIKKMIDEYKKKRKSKIDMIKLDNELKKANKMISMNVIYKDIMSFDENKAISYDMISNKVLQRNIQIINKAMYLIYNIQWVLRTRLFDFNMGQVSWYCKSGKEKRIYDNYRPLTIVSCFNKPMDKRIAIKLLTVGINCNFIPFKHFGFIKSLGCVDAITYVYDIICKNSNRNIKTHGIFMDLDSCFDTIKHDYVVGIMRFDFYLNGHLMAYIELIFTNRWIRVIVNGYTTEWFPETFGLGQGLPPSSILYLYVVVDFNIINELKLGWILVTYADDQLLVNNGLITKRNDLEINLKLTIDIITYLVRDKMLLMSVTKQEYIVWDMNMKKTEENHKDNYFDAKMLNDDNIYIKIKQNYKSIKYIGCHMDVRVNFEYHMSLIYNKCNNISSKIKNKFGNNNYITPFWLKILFTSLVDSKLFMIEHWGDSNLPIKNKIKKMINDNIRFINGDTFRSVPIEYLCMQSKYITFDEMVLYKKANLWSKTIRIPKSNIIYDVINNEFWENWQEIRHEDKKIEKNKTKRINISIDGIQPKEIQIINELNKNDLDMKEEWDYKDRNDDEDESFMIKKKKKGRRKKNKLNQRVFDNLFDAAKKLESSDYKFMKNIEFDQIGKKISCEIPELDLPTNLLNCLLNDKGEKQAFNIEWIQNKCKILGIDENQMLLTFSDGSVKDLIGGSGYIACDLNYYNYGIIFDELIKNKFTDPYYNKETKEFNFIYNTKSIGLRTSIEFCEFEGAILALEDIYNELENIDNNKKYICMAIDNESVCKWLTGTNKIKDKLIYEKINKIYDKINDLKDLDIKVIISWIKAHENEKGNELADRLAKLAMMNYYQSLYWKDIIHNYSIDDWINISLSAIKKENKRKAWYRCLDNWKNVIKKKKKCMNDSLTKYIMKWNINYNIIFKYESKHLIYKHYKLLTQLRTGHNHLNSQRKWGIDKKCVKIDCIENETLLHFLFECSKSSEESTQLINDIQDIYGNDLNFKDLDIESKLKHVLFPYNDEIYDKNLMKDIEIKNAFFEKRLHIIDLLINFCINTGRFDDLFAYKYNIKTW